jgi:putative peptide maturation dehydrogenase
VRVRRCDALVIEPSAVPSLDIGDLLAGGDGVRTRVEIRVWAAHLDEYRRVSAEQAQWLLHCSAECWQDLPVDADSRALVLSLLELELLVAEDVPDTGTDPAPVRRPGPADGNWWPLAAIHHRHSRWQGVDSVTDMERSQLVTAQDLRRQLGSPPPAVVDHPLSAGQVDLPDVPASALESLGRMRVTCRNFDPGRALSLGQLSAVLQQTFRAHAQLEPAPGLVFLKKNVPSAGGLHPLEACLLVQRVEGLAPGLYRYHPVRHALTPVVPEQEFDAEMAGRFLAGQHWFADAAVLAILVCRFERSLWKYRNHRKVYRAMMLDAGHMSQALYMAATECGLGAFVTSAINEIDIEKVLALDPLKEGPLAICGMGWRTQERTTAELDPLQSVWPAPAGT